MSWRRMRSGLLASSGGGFTNLTFHNHYSGDSGLGTTNTLQDVAIGSAAAGKAVIIGLAVVDIASTTISGVTLHVPDVATDPTGTAMTQVVAGVRTNDYYAQFWICEHAGGPTGDVVVTTTTTPDGLGIWSLSMSGHGSTTATDTMTDEDGSTPLTGSLLVPANGAAVALVFNNASGMFSYTWTGLTEVYDGLLGDTRIASLATGEFASEQNELSIEALFSITQSAGVLAGASWGP